jgi:DNA-directed RNA polymerase subunit beta'
MEELVENLIDFEGLRISLASPEIIRSWSHGEVVKPETINYRTLKPEKDGLFCERIFGPTRDFECYCGKYKKIRYRGIICDKCGVEVTRSRVRRERMGHIHLISPVVHMWFLRGAPSTLSTLLEMPLRSLESVVYFASYLVTDVDTEKQTQVLNRLKKELSSKKEKLAKAAKAKIEREKKEFQRKEKELTKRQKKEVKETRISELEREMREKIEEIKTGLVLEQTSLEENYKSFSEQVKKVSQLSLLAEEEHLRLSENNASAFFRSSMGAEALFEVLSRLDR